MGANAVLFDRGGGLIYDDVLNVTWLQDANYAQTSGYDADGLMGWADANTWAARLSFGGYDDWRLPNITWPLGSYNLTCTSYDGSTDCGYNITNKNNELAHLYYIGLGNQADYDTSGNAQTHGPTITGPFINLLGARYWTGTPLPTAWGPNQSFTFSFESGLKEWDMKQDPYYATYAWAVRGSDIATVPEPETYAMMLAGLWLVGAAAQRRKQAEI